MGNALFSVLAVSGLMFAMGSSASGDVIDFYLTQAEGNGTTAPAPIAASNSDAVEVIVTTCQGAAGGFNASTLACNTAGTTGPYTEATVEFVGLNAGTTSVPDPVLINVNGAITAASTSNAGGLGGPGSGGGFGTLSNETGAGSHDTITIDLVAATTGQWTDAADVLIPTCPGTTAAVAGVCADGTAGQGYNKTEYSHGFEAFDDAASSPQHAGEYVAAAEPSAVLLLTSMLIGLAFVLRRKFFASA